MLKVGLTGGVASGKSTVLEMFARRGAHVVRADEVAHQLISPGNAVYERVVAEFGREILNLDGTINRPKLASLAFPNRTRELNAIVHPAVLEAEDRWAEEILMRDPKAIVIEEAALLIEAGGHKRMDHVIVVTCPFETKVERFASRSGLSLDAARAEVTRRMAAQMSDAEKSALADYVIDSSGTLQHVEQQVESIWHELTHHFNAQ
ncbi:MAG TPA: dephospho-CoA kinase [Candidatus Acidoferrales bacterium]|nr:dephospho-CoA kinase [Candidatus Acidoferrales bacterium]